ncbi:hypothetical protein [Atopobium sp. oral taxon 416]|nr:hypothetical protein [Atopobium sp. oral taxon 416]QUC04113.1 hypothetical protein J4859_04005 [Atopobium sp. oral taxon 416]
MQQGQVERVIYVAVDAGEVAHFGVECTGTYGAGAALSTSRASTCRSSS